jgi:alkylhydroperoxidase/carboxymuconolactone decarboxylase family protein YurZ
VAPTGRHLRGTVESKTSKEKGETMAYEGTLVLEYLSRTHDTSLLTDREKHLIGLAVTMTRGCQLCTRGRIEKARDAGISDDVLNALVGIVSAVNAGVAAATAREGFRQAETSAVDACGSLCSAQ